MAFEIEKQKRIPDQVRRVVRDRLSKARDALGTPRGNPRGEAIHTARKRLKEARATLRLVREEIGKSFQSNNRVLRDAGRELSKVRDAHVLVSALDDLLKSAKFKKNPYERFRRKLERQERTAMSAYDSRGFVRRVDAVDQGLPDLSFDHDGWRAIKSNIQRTYKDGRAAMKNALHQPADAAWHQWRKRAKDLRYQFELLSPVWPVIFGAIARQAHALSDLLGTDHDLAVLRTTAKKDRHLPTLDRDNLLDAIDAQRQKLRRKARKLGCLLYAESPAVFIKRIKRYWRNAR
jgi:CHAD domain-containing protein